MDDLAKRQLLSLERWIQRAATVRERLFSRKNRSLTVAARQVNQSIVNSMIEATKIGVRSFCVMSLVRTTPL